MTAGKKVTMLSQSRRLYLQGVLNTLRTGAVQVIGLGGFAVFIEGIREIYQPAALIVGGGLVVTWTILKVRRT
jgi:hypothetical protein